MSKLILILPIFLLSCGPISKEVLEPNNLHSYPLDTKTTTENMLEHTGNLNVHVNVKYPTDNGQIIIKF